MNLFVAHTPYHIILSLTLVSTIFERDNNILIICRDFELKNFNIELLEQFFDLVYVLEGSFDISKNDLISKVKRVRQYKTNIDFIIRIIAEYKIKLLFIFNDTIPVEKKVLETVKKNNFDSDIKVVYVEDGFGAYVSHEGLFNNNVLTKIKDFLKKRIYSIKKESPIMGGSEEIDEYMVLFPKLLNRQFLQRKVIKEITRDQLVIGIYNAYSNYIKEMNDFDKCIIIFLDHTDLFKVYNGLQEKYINVIYKILELAKIQDMKIYLKYHPREKEYYIKNVKKFNNLDFINKCIPSEAVFLKCNKNSIIITGLSTSLVTASKLDEHFMRISLMKILNIYNKRVADTYQKLGIFLPENFGELQAELIGFFMD